MEYMIWSMMMPNCPGKWDASQRPFWISRDSTRKSEEVKGSQSSSSSSSSSSSLTLQARCCNQHIGRCRFEFHLITVYQDLFLNRLLWEHFIFGHTGAWIVIRDVLLWLRQCFPSGSEKGWCWCFQKGSGWFQPPPYFTLCFQLSGTILFSKSAQAEGSTLFRYPSYVQDIMGDIFSLGFGPFRWTFNNCQL